MLPAFARSKSPAVHTGMGWVDVGSIGDPPPEVIPAPGSSDNSSLQGPDGNTYRLTSRYPDVKESVVCEGGTEYILDALGKKKWSSKPCFDNQYTLPHMIRRDPMQAMVLNLSCADDLAKYNDLQAKCIPGGPSVEMQPVSLQFHDGQFFAFVTYNKVWYLNPVQ